MGFPRQEYRSGLPLPSPGDLPDPGIEPTSPAWQADSLALSHLGSPCSNIEGLYQSLPTLNSYPSEEPSELQLIADWSTNVEVLTKEKPIACLFWEIVLVHWFCFKILKQYYITTQFREIQTCHRTNYVSER